MVETDSQKIPQHSIEIQHTIPRGKYTVYVYLPLSSVDRR